MGKKSADIPKPVAVKMNDKQSDRFQALVAGVEKSELIYQANKAQLDLYIGSIRDAQGISEELTGIAVEDGTITFSIPQDGPKLEPIR